MPPEVAVQTEPVESAEVPHLLAVAPFAKWKYEDAQKALADVLPTDYTITAGYVVDKNHFQKGTEWVGPGDATTNTTIEKQFAPEDAIGEVLANIENAFSNPQLGGTPILETPATTESVKARLNELLPILEEWWHTQRMQEHIQNNQRTAAWAGWADLRLWIPHRFLLRNPDNTITVQEATSIEEALNFIHVMVPQPKWGAIITDKSTMDKIAVFLDVEVEFAADGKRIDFPRAELVYLDPERVNDKDSETTLRITYANEDKPDVVAELPLGGRLLMAEMSANILITDPVIRTQRQLNLLTTIVTRIGETAAFRERYTTNAKPQGLRIPYEDGDTLKDGAFIERDDEGRQWQVIPQPRTLGASTTTELVGLPIADERGDQKNHSQPGVVIVDPVDPGPYLLAADSVRRRILRMCAQGHLGGVSNAESSGIAYEQARAVFEKDLEKRKTSQEGMLRELLTTALALAENLSGNEGRFTNFLRLTVEQNINAGPRSPDLVRLDLEAYEAGVLSKSTVMTRLGIDDTNAEIARIDTSTAHIMSILERAGTASQTFTTESVIEVMRELGVPEDILAALEVPEVPEQLIPGQTLEDEPNPLSDTDIEEENE